MLEKQRQTLEKRAGGYLSIGITKDGIPTAMVSVPWVATAQAYNMRIPDVYLAPEDLQDEEMMAIVKGCKVIGCYIFTALEDYSFLEALTDMEDLNIFHGENVRDLSFMREMKKCHMFFLADAKLPDLAPIMESKHRSNFIYRSYRCVALYNCCVEDVSALEDQEISFSEFLIWNPPERNEREKWSVVNAGTYRYYELKK